MFENLKNKFNIVKGKKPILVDTKDEKSFIYLSTEYLRDGKVDKYALLSSVGEKYLCKNDDLAIIWDGSNSGEIFLAKEGILSSTMAKLELIDNNK